LVLPLTACQQGGKLAEAFKPADAPVPVKLPSACDFFLQPVAPSKFTARSDAIAAFTRRDDELAEANTRISIGRDCHDDERAAYANGGANRAGPARDGGAK
jgi:hypothetical protein